jgi:uncharacterized protein YbaR (Trm112 family)
MARNCLPRNLTGSVVSCVTVQVCLQEGALICPETGRRFPVVNGIPNMLLAEDEV